MSYDVTRFQGRSEVAHLVKTRDGAATPGIVQPIGSRPHASIQVSGRGNVIAVSNDFIEWIKPLHSGGNRQWEWMAGYEEGDTVVEVWFRSSGGAEHHALYRKEVGFVDGPGPVIGHPGLRVQQAERVPDDFLDRCAENLEEMMADDEAQ